MAKLVRYGNYLRELAAQQQWIAIRSPRDAPAWLRRLRAPGLAFACLAAILLLFPLFALREAPAGGWNAAAGLALLVAGVLLFREGARIAIVPLGEAFARAGAARAPLVAALAVAFLLGLAVALVEPVGAALRAAGAGLAPQDDAYLYALVGRQSALFWVIGSCTGVAAALGLLRILHGWSLRPLILVMLVPAIGLSGHLLFDPELARVPAFAWDCGALMAGPVTVLLLLACGSGAAGATGAARLPAPGFGIAALATILPVLGVLVYAMVLAEAGAVELAPAPAESPLPSPAGELLQALVAVGPLALAFWLLLQFSLQTAPPRPGRLLGGLALSLAGLALIGLGITHSLELQVDQAGNGIAALLDPSAAWPGPTGIAIAAAVLGAAVWQGARAEPALHVFAEIADTHTHGVLRQDRLIGLAAAGAGGGAFLGVLHAASGFDIGWLLTGGWIAALALAAMAGEETAAAAWDGAAAMTGPLTVTVLLAAATGLPRYLGAPAAFGFPALCLLGSVLAVLAYGALARSAHARRRMLRNAGFALS